MINNGVEIPKNIADAICQNSSDQLALRDQQNQIITYGSLNQEIARFQAGLRTHGFKTGHRIFVLLPNSNDLLSILIALFAEGCVPVVIDPRLPFKMWIKAIEHAQPIAIISSYKLLRFRWIQWKLFRYQLFQWEGSAFGVKDFQSLRSQGSVTSFNKSLQDSTTQSMNLEDEVLITYTSGTTGKPNPIIRTHKVIATQQVLSRKYLPPLKNDVHMAGYTVSILQSLVEGAINQIPDLSNMEINIVKLNEGLITRLSGPPGFLAHMAKTMKAKGISIFTVENILIGGAPIPRWLLRDLILCFPNASITLVYGCTECEPIAFGEAQYYLDNNLSGYFVGHPIAEVKIHQEPFPLWHAPDSFIISLSGANVVLANQNLTHQTGDIATYDNSGALWLLGRTADLIQLPQGITAPAAFETIIEEIPGIIRVAIIQRKQSVILFYEGQKGLEEQILEKLFDLNITIDWIVHLEKIPVDRRHQWKIQRKLLQVEGKFPGRVFKKTYVSSKVSNS